MLNSTHTKKNRNKKKQFQRWKSVIQINEQCCIWKAVETVRNRIDVKRASNKKDYIKWTSKPSYMSHKIFDNDLVAVRKNKAALTFNRPACIRMCILELSKVLMYEFHYDYVKNKYGNNSRLLFTDIDSLMYKIKTEDVYEDFRKVKETFEFSNYSTKSKYYDNSNKVVVREMKDKTAGVANEEFDGLKPKMYSYLVDICCDNKS